MGAVRDAYLRICAAGLILCLSSLVVRCMRRMRSRARKARRRHDAAAGAYGDVAEGLECIGGGRTAWLTVCARARRRSCCLWYRSRSPIFAPSGPVKGDVGVHTTLDGPDKLEN